MRCVTDFVFLGPVLPKNNRLSAGSAAPIDFRTQSAKRRQVWNGNTKPDGWQRRPDEYA